MGNWKGIVDKGFTSRDLATYAAGLYVFGLVSSISGVAQYRRTKAVAASGEQGMKNLEKILAKYPKMGCRPLKNVKSNLKEKLTMA